MIFLIAFVIFGFVGGLAVKSFMEGRGSIGAAASIILGLVGSFVPGILLLFFGESLVGVGLNLLVSLLSAVIGAIILPLIVTIIKK